MPFRARRTAVGGSVGARWSAGSASERGLVGACGAQAVEDDQDLGDFVDEHDGGQAQDAGDGQGWQRGDDEQRQDDVLVDDAPPASGVGDRLGQEPQVLAGAREMVAGVTRSAQGMGGALAWPALLRKLDLQDPSYKS